jgi:TPR repeat protein
VPGGVVVHKYDYGKVCAPAPEYIAAMIEQDAKARRVAESATLKLDQEKAEEGNPMYQYRLGLRYQNGNGVEVDRDKARYWLRKAAAQGYEEARTALLNFNAPKPEAEPGTNAPAGIR